MVYGERVRSLRTRMSLSQAELGRLIGCKRANVSSVELGRWRFGRDAERKLASLAGVQWEYIAGAPVGGVESSDAA